MHETILVLDFGGQYNQLIARRVREQNVYAEVLNYTTPLEEIKAKNYKGIIFTGGPNSIYDPASPTYEKGILELGIPVLGICYGAQLMAHLCGAPVKTAPVSEYGKTEVLVDEHDGVLKYVALPEYGKDVTGCDKPGRTIMWMSHTDYTGHQQIANQIIKSMKKYNPEFF